MYINPSKPSGHYMYRQFIIQQFCVLPTVCFLCFVWISEQTAIISLYNKASFYNRNGVFTARHGLNLLVMYINPSKTSGHYMYHQFNIQHFYVLPTQCI